MMCVVRMSLDFTGGSFISDTKTADGYKRDLL
jgi:hypothetical protein